MRVASLKNSSSLRYFTFFYLYVMQGIPAGFALTAIANYLVGKGISSSSVGTFVSIVGLPWILQFVWGPLIDRYQYSVIGHRKHWVVLTQIAAFLASLTLLFVKDPASHLSLMSLVFFTHSIFASVQDASVDAMAISLVPHEEKGRLNAFMRGGFLIGVSFGAAALAFVLHKYSFYLAALIQSITLLFFTVLTFFIKLDEHDPLLPSFAHKNKLPLDEKNPSVREVFKDLWQGMTEKYSLRTFGIIALVYLCSSIFIRSYSYHLIQVLKWPSHEVSILQGTYGSLITLVVTISGGILADRIGADKMQVKVMWGLTLFLLVFNSTYLFWHFKFMAGGGLLLWSLADPLFSVAAFPVIMNMCSEHIEGSQFTAYMALINFCDVLGSYFTGWALHVVAAPLLGFGCGIVILSAIFIVYKIKRRKLLYAQLENSYQR
jgi:PAT family beta-lactamase induction signal transducer AmpG